MIILLVASQPPNSHKEGDPPSLGLSCCFINFFEKMIKIQHR